MNVTIEYFLNMSLEALHLFLCLLFSSSMKKRSGFYWKGILSFLVFVSLSFFSYGIDVGNSILSNTLNYSLIFVSGVCFLFLLFDIHFVSALFFSVLSYSYRHLIYLFWQLLSYLSEAWFSLDMSSFSYVWLLLAFLSGLVYVPLGIIFYRHIKEYPNVVLPTGKIILAASLSLFINIVLNNFALYYDFSSMSPSLPYVLNLSSFMATAMLLLILFGNVREASLQDEIRAINQLRYQEEKQYHLSKESIDLINIKCHDLRHQIRDLKNSGKVVSKEELTQIEDAIRIYDTRVKTGNSSLDVILQEKSLICQKNKIMFDYIIDGKQLSFMKENDIYSLFGNIIDNSIEACMKIQKEDMRVIRLKIKSTMNGVLAVAENPYVGEIKMKDGLPITSKGDDRYHGYGLKSIAHLVRSYHGTIKISTDNQLFVLTMFFLK